MYNQNGFAGSDADEAEASEPRPLSAGEQELAITKLMCSRLNLENCLCPGERESVAYRFAEIMTAAKSLYTELLPRLVNPPEPSEGAEAEPLFNELAGARMLLIHLRDLIGEFDDVFMEAMAEQRKADGHEERLPDPEEIDE